MVTYVTRQVIAKNVSAAKADELAKAQAVVDALRKEIEAEYLASPEGLGLKAISQPGAYSSGQLIVSWPHPHTMQVSLGVAEDINRKNPVHSPIHSLGEKTINTLLNGKLLTDAEKRAVVAELTKGVIPPVAAAQDLTVQEMISRVAVEYADALIAELAK